MATQKQFLRVEGDVVHVVTERVERMVRLGDLMDEVARQSGISTPILPQRCRMFRSQGDRSVFVIEQVPATRTVAWDRMSDCGNTSWRLAFPYVIFLVAFSGQAVDTGSTRVFYRTAPLDGTDAVVLRPNLCNTYQDGRICTGDFRVSGDTLAAKAESFVSGFWRSRFNSDLWECNWGPASQHFPQVKSLAAWQEETVKNPLFPLGVSWFEAGRLSQFLG